MVDIYVKENPEMQLIGSAIKLVLRERKRQDDKWGSNRNLDDMTWLTILTEEVGESAEAILKNLPEKVYEVVQITAVALAWLECILRVAEQRDGAVQPQHDGGLTLKLVHMVNSLGNIVIDASGKGYVSGNDLDFANDCLDKVIPLLPPS